MSVFRRRIALTPRSGGGMCIDRSALKPADIIVSTVSVPLRDLSRPKSDLSRPKSDLPRPKSDLSHWESDLKSDLSHLKSDLKSDLSHLKSDLMSDVIRMGTFSVVSHGSLYDGNGSVVEAIGEGVAVTPIYKALGNDALAVVYRRPTMCASTACRIVKFAKSKIGYPYNAIRALASPIWGICRIDGNNPTSFFCSELVIEAYRHAGVNLTNLPASCVTPGKLVEIAKSQLVYVGHLRGNPSLFPVLSP